MPAKRKTTITPPQKRLYDFIVTYRAKHGVSPLRTEIAQAIGHRRHGSVNAMVNRMVERGFLRVAACPSRNLVPLL